jgi:hypothetical protein
MQLTSILNWVLGLEYSHAGLKASSHDRTVIRDGFHAKRERRRPPSEISYVASAVWLDSRSGHFLAIITPECQMTHVGGVGLISSLGEPVQSPILHTLAGNMQHGLRSLWNVERPSEHLLRLIHIAAGISTGKKLPLLTPTMSVCGGEACNLGSLITLRTPFRPVLPCETKAAMLPWTN